MRNKNILISILVVAAGMAHASDPATLEQAESTAVQQGKPVLIEFFQPDCEYCHLAAQDFAANDSILKALKSVVYLPLDVNSEEGDRLSSIYYVQSDFPVFALTDRSGEIIDHWTGYNAAAQFVAKLRQALSSSITINDRYERLKSYPSVEDAIFLARFNAEIGDNVKSAELYRRAQELRESKTYVYDIFQNMAEAVWKDKIQFEQLIPAADDVLVQRADDITQVAGVARIIANVARKTGKTSEISKYLKAGIDITEGRTDPRSREWQALFTGDWALYVEHDTARAVSIEKENLGPDWENRPDKFYSYSKWCLDRKINLGEAEIYARQAVGRATEGKFKATILATLSGIYEAQGKITEAAASMRTAVGQDSTNTWYPSEVKRLRDLAGKKK